jgi:hypothetical protein
VGALAIGLGLAGSLAMDIARADGKANVPEATKKRRDDLNATVLKVLATYPTDGTHDYWWPKDSSYDGVTADVRYRGEVVARGEAKKRTFCCGLTFEVYVRACEAWAKKKRPGAEPGYTIGGLDPAGLRSLKSDWFVATDGRKGPVDALVPRALGLAVPRLEDARPGDFVQLWRESGSGHSVIFLGWERQAGEIAAIRYWSTQTATKGIGERTERFHGKNAVKRDEVYIVRAFVPDLE